MASVIAMGALNQPDQALADPWTFKSSLSVTEQYYDNVFLSSGPNDPNGPERSDTVTILTPALTISRNTSRLTFVARYQPSFNFYAKYHNELNYIAQTGLLTLGVNGLGPGALQATKLDLSEAFTYTQQGLYNYPLTGGVTGNGGVITNRTTSWSNVATARLSQPLTSTLQGIASCNSAITRYQDPGLTDSDQLDFSLNLRDRLTQRIAMTATYRYTTYSYSNVNVADKRPVTHSMGVGIDFAVTPTLETHIGIGDTYLSTDNSQHFSSSASVTKQFKYTRAAVSYYNQLSAGGGITQAPAVNHTTTLSLIRTLGPHANATVSGGYTNQRSTTTQSTDTHSFTIRASAGYAVAKWLQAIVSYNHSAQQGTNGAAGLDLRWNTVALTVNGTWETPIP